MLKPCPLVRKETGSPGDHTLKRKKLKTRIATSVMAA
jgi:hypothetical protein